MWPDVSMRVMQSAAPSSPAPSIEPSVPEVFAGLYSEIADCPRCPLARTRTRTVPGSGPADAAIMFVGEGPGAREDERGLPFVGPAGRFLDELLAGIGLSRELVYITNVVKCRPPGNRDPEPQEIEACSSYLDEQVRIVDPQVIVTLGRFSMQRWFPGASIGRVHGQPQRLGERWVVPMYHPAAALHRGELRAVIQADFERLPALLDRLRGASDAGSTASAPAEAKSAPTPLEPPQERLL